MGITKSPFGTTKGGQEVFLYTLENGKGLSAEITNFGGIIKSIYITDQKGGKTDVVLGYDTLDGYETIGNFFGAAVGRHANRIAGGKFELNGTVYQVGVNEGKNSLHGGLVGFDRKVWEAEAGGTAAEPALILTLTSPDGEEGFPGELKVTMMYALTKENGLSIHYEAVSNKDTVVNMTNHSYFNLAGHNSGPVYDQVLQINSGFYTPNDLECMPTGEVLSVSGTPFDFRAPKPIGQDIDADFEQIQRFSGFDHNYPIAGRGWRKAAAAVCPSNGICMEVYTNKPAMQLYTTNSLAEGTPGKCGAAYGKHYAFCLETQYFPNAMSFSHYPAPILKAGEAYDFTTEYRFCVK